VTTTDQPSQQTGAKPTVLLVHGAFADASSWNGVIERLQQQGYTCIASANPLRGVTADSAYIRPDKAGRPRSSSRSTPRRPRKPSPATCPTSRSR
jgi:alpha-beta hydrolase superfamily lysophospholipase